MSDTFEFDDRNHAERFVGTLHDPAATPGDVLTVQADGSVAAAPGGGSQPFAFVTLASSSGFLSGDVIPFDTVISDAGGFWDAANHQFVIPAGKGGIYQIGCYAYPVGADGALDPVVCEILGSFTGPQIIEMGLASAGVHENAGAFSALAIANDGENIQAVINWQGAATNANLATCQMWLVRLGDAP